MVASHSSASPSAWKPTTRTLGALFAGSAVTLSATLVHGSSLLTGNDAGSLAEPLASPILAEPEEAHEADPDAFPTSVGQAVSWTPGAAPQWSSSLKDLPVWRAPVQQAPPQAALVAQVPGATAAAAPTSSQKSTAGTAAPEHHARGASTSPAGSGSAAPQAADPQQDESAGALLSNVFDVSKGLPE